MRGLVTIKGGDLPEVAHALDCAASVIPLCCPMCGGTAEEAEKIRRFHYAVGRNYQAVQNAREALSKRLGKMRRPNPVYNRCCDDEIMIRARASEKDGKIPRRTLEDGTEEIIVPADKQDEVRAAVEALWAKPEHARARKMREKDQARIEAEIEKPVSVPMHVVAWPDVPLGMKAQYIAYIAPLMLAGVPANLLADAEKNNADLAIECSRLLFFESPAVKLPWYRRLGGRRKKTHGVRIALKTDGE